MLFGLQLPKCDIVRFIETHSIILISRQYLLLLLVFFLVLNIFNIVSSDVCLSNYESIVKYPFSQLHDKYRAHC